MIRVLRTTDPRFAALRRRLARRGEIMDAGVEPVVRAILDDVRRRGDRARSNGSSSSSTFVFFVFEQIRSCCCCCSCCFVGD